MRKIMKNISKCRNVRMAILKLKSRHVPAIASVRTALIIAAAAVIVQIIKVLLTNFNNLKSNKKHNHWCVCKNNKILISQINICKFHNNNNYNNN